MKIARVCKIRDVTSQITALFSEVMTTEAVSGQARLLLYRNFLFNAVIGRIFFVAESNARCFCIALLVLNILIQPA